MTDDEFNQFMGNAPPAQQQPAAAPQGGGGAGDYSKLLGGYSTPEEYAVGHANFAGQLKARQGIYTMEDLKNDIDTHYKEGLKIVQDERNREAQAQLDLQKEGILKQQQEQLDVQKSKEQANIDLQKTELEKGITRQPTDDEREQAQQMTYIWNSIPDLQRAYDQARKEAPMYTGASGELIGKFTDEHGFMRGFTPASVAAFNARAKTIAGPATQGIMNYTSGGETKTGVMHEVLPDLIPSLSDNPDAFKAKIQNLYDSTAQQANAFATARGGKNSQGNPAVDLKSLMPALQGPMDYLNKRDQQQQQTAPTNTVMTPATQNAYQQARNAALAKTNQPPVPMAPQTTPPAGSASPTPSPMGTAPVLPGWGT